jgi:hypothetical protein
VPQHEQFRILERRRTTQQDKPASKPHEDQIEQTQRHGRSLCPTATPHLSRQVTAIGRLLAPHRRIAAAHRAGRLLAPHKKTELAKAFGRWWHDTGGTDDPRFVFWHSIEPGMASFGPAGVITEIGLTVFGADCAALQPDDRRRAVQDLLAEHRLLLIWDSFSTARSIPDPGGATPPLDEAGCQELLDFLETLARVSGIS